MTGWSITAFGLDVTGAEALFPGRAPEAPSPGGWVELARMEPHALDHAHEGASTCEPPQHLAREGFRTFRCDDGSFLVDAPGVARVLVSSRGDRLEYATDGRDDRWPLLIAARALPLAAALRGLEPLHAAAVQLTDGRRIAIAGPSGAGKTSVACHLVLRGATLLCDDVLALQRHGEACWAYPGVGWLSVPPDVERALGPAAATLGRVAWMGGKAFHAVPRVASPGPLDALYVLARDGGGSGASAVTPTLPALIALGFMHVVDGAARRVAQLDALGALAAHVPVIRLASPAAWTAADTAAAIAGE